MFLEASLRSHCKMPPPWEPTATTSSSVGCHARPVIRRSNGTTRLCTIHWGVSARKRLLASWAGSAAQAAVNARGHCWLQLWSAATQNSVYVYTDYCSIHSHVISGTIQMHTACCTGFEAADTTSQHARARTHTHAQSLVT